MNRKQLDGSHTQTSDVVDDFLTCEACEGATKIFRDLWTTLRETLDMQLINNRPIPWDGGPASPTGANRAVVGPSERGIDYDALRHQRRAIQLIESEIVSLSAECVTEQLGTPLELTDMLLRIGIQYQLIGIEPMAFVGFIGAVYAIGRYRAWRRVGQISVPD